MLKKFAIPTLLAALLLSGCGSSDSTDTAENAEITVERGPVLGALVLDDEGNQGVPQGQGRYRFENRINYPVTVKGGYIDVNRNDEVDSGDVALRFTLRLQQGSAATLVSTVATNAQIRTMLQERLDLNDSAIDDQTPGENRDIAAVSDEIYAYCIENGIEPLQLQLREMEIIENQIRERIRNYGESNRSAADLEAELIESLDVPTVDESDLAQIAAIISGMQASKSVGSQQGTSHSLTTIQEEDLLFMVEEEKMARDVYEYLYTLWQTDIFANIAKSEQRHMDSVETLLATYGLEAPETLDNRGTFEDGKLQAMYDSLIAKGTISLADALEVGVTIEVTDIEDLELLLEDTLPNDVQNVYANLLSGSYSHLSAFNSQLQAE